MATIIAQQRLILLHPNGCRNSTKLDASFLLVYRKWLDESQERQHLKDSLLCVGRLPDEKGDRQLRRKRCLTEMGNEDRGILLPGSRDPLEAKGCRPLSANPLAHLQPARRLGVVEVDGKRIPRRRNSDLHQDPPDLAAVIAAMRDDMCQHFLA